VPCDHDEEAAVKRKKALELQQAWCDRPCDHPGFAKEYDQGARTGNFICTQCGAILSVREKVAITSARKAADAPAEADDAGSDPPTDSAPPSGGSPPADSRRQPGSGSQ
jgi:hypothetical protein